MRATLGDRIVLIHVSVSMEIVAHIMVAVHVVLGIWACCVISSVLMAPLVTAASLIVHAKMEQPVITLVGCAIVQLVGTDRVVSWCVLI